MISRTFFFKKNMISRTIIAKKKKTVKLRENETRKEEMI